MSDLQGITVAIAPSGIQYFNSIILSPTLVTKLANLSPAEQKINIGPIDYYVTEFGTSYYAPIENVLITLSGGQLHTFNPAIQPLMQQVNGQFSLTMVANNFSAAFTWNEQYVLPISLSQGQQHNDNFQNYTIGFGSLKVVIIFDFNYANDAWSLEIATINTTPAQITPNVPSKSILTKTGSGCGNSVSDACKNAVDNIDFSSAVKAAIGSQFASIPATGRITGDISFLFEEGPNGLTFPGDAGILAGVTGVASYQGTVYSAPNPPTLPMPAMPTDKHLAYNVSDYSFNSLMWAFFSAGKLKGYVTPGSLSDPRILNTSTYQGSSLQALYDAYPNLNMTANIVTKAAPTVSFVQIYDLTSAAYARFQSQLPADIYGKLKSMVDQAYITEPAFHTALVNAIGQDGANNYSTQIEQAAIVLAGVVNMTHEVVLNVVQNGQEIPVITFDVTQTDTLQNLALGHSGAAQTVMFAFQNIPELTQTQFISSSLHGVDGGDFGYIWETALQLEYTNVMAAIGQTGVALPRIANFNLLFDQAVITINNGYIEVVTDVLHTSDAGAALYHASKR